MRFLLPDPLGNDKHPQMFHSTGFAIAAGVVAVGAAAGAGAISMSAADRAKKAQGKASKSYKKQLQKATDEYNLSIEQYNKKQDEVRGLIKNIDPNINIPQYSLEGSTQEAIRSANAVTDNTIAQLRNLIARNPSDIIQQGLAKADQWQGRLVNQYERIEGAYPLLQSAQAGIQAQLPQLQRARQIVSQLAEGDLTDRQRKQLAQVNAEMVGATYNPEAARRASGFQIGQAQLLEATRQASEERQRYGLALVPSITQQTAILASQQGDIAARYGQLAGQQAQLGEAARGWQGTAMAWMELGKSFQQPVSEMMGIGLQGRQQDIGIAEANILNQFRRASAIGDINAAELNAAQNRYNALTGQAQNVYQANQQNIGASYASQMAGANTLSNVGGAVAGGLMGYSGALGQLNAAKGGGAGALGGSQSITGFGGKQYIPATSASGGQYYKPVTPF